MDTTRLTKSILRPEFKYTPAAQTDIRKTFALWRKEQKAATGQAGQVNRTAPSEEGHAAGPVQLAAPVVMLRKGERG